MSNAVQTACKHSPSEHTVMFTDRPTTFICNKTPRLAECRGCAFLATAGEFERKSGGAALAMVMLVGLPEARLQML